jgi:predicted DNA binding protein
MERPVYFLVGRKSIATPVPQFGQPSRPVLRTEEESRFALLLYPEPRLAGLRRIAAGVTVTKSSSPTHRPGRPAKGIAVRVPGRSSRESTETRLRNLRRDSTEPEPDRLFLATLRIRIPNQVWTGPFTSLHPGVRMEALNRTEVDSGVSVSDYWISGAPGVWARDIATFPDVVKIDSLAEVGDGCLYRITYRNPPIIGLYQRLRLPIQFPLRLQAGYIRWEIVARRSEFDLIMKHARAVDPDFSIVSIRRRPLRSHLPMLTESQEQLLNQAMAAGYFAVPRGITLTALARKLNRSKSGISESIALIEKKLFETVLQPETGLA